MGSIIKRLQSNVIKREPSLYRYKVHQSRVADFMQHSLQ